MDTAPFTLEITQDAPAVFHAPPCSGALDLRLGDCMEVMATFADGHFDLAIVDPPYGLERFKKGGSHLNKHGSENGQWNNEKPGAEYWKELFRVSRHQIVWGGNNFDLPVSERFIVWHKPNMPEGMSFASCEYAWTNFPKPAKLFSHHSSLEERIHPTQKPVALYKWILANYTKPGQRVLDTHLGSGSHAIAAHYAGIHLTACEIDPEYFHAAKSRIARETSQADFFSSQNTALHEHEQV
jgi:site-specific DNA-methyltransferase (adenine-specific)